ncbi:helix-turn-helix transcriptional regulator [Candidatus Izimaplasma bacterium]|nr:helix-turn-helix transcriptional regulator [Candidatus Izimaplasma bacterium]
MNEMLNILTRMGDAIAKTFGDNCEVVVHDLNRELENTISYIKNGHVSNRKLGDGASALVLNAFNHSDINHEDKLNYIIRDGDKYIKCSSLFFNENDTLRYIFAINFDISDLIRTQEAINQLVVHEKEEQFDRFPVDVNDMLDRLILQSVDKVGKPIDKMNYKEKSVAIKFLDECGAFLIKKAGEKVAEVFGISKYTIYNHMK